MHYFIFVLGSLATYGCSAPMMHTSSRSLTRVASDAKAGLSGRQHDVDSNGAVIYHGYRGEAMVRRDQEEASGDDLVVYPDYRRDTVVPPDGEGVDGDVLVVYPDYRRDTPGQNE